MGVLPFAVQRRQRLAVRCEGDAAKRSQEAKGVQLLAGGRVAQHDLPLVQGHGRQGLAVRREDGLEKGEAIQPFAGGQIPHGTGVGTRRRQELAIGRKREVEHVDPVKRTQLLAGVRLPEVEPGAIGARGGNGPAIAGEADEGSRVRVLEVCGDVIPGSRAMLVQQLAGRRVVETEPMTIRAGEQPVIGRERHRSPRPGPDAVVRALLAGGDVPETDRSIAVHRCECLAVRQERRRPNERAVPQPRGAEPAERADRQRIAVQVGARLTLAGGAWAERQREADAEQCQSQRMGRHGFLPPRCERDGQTIIDCPLRRRRLSRGTGGGPCFRNER